MLSCGHERAPASPALSGLSRLLLKSLGDPLPESLGDPLPKSLGVFFPSHGAIPSSSTSTSQSPQPLASTTCHMLTHRERSSGDQGRCDLSPLLAQARRMGAGYPRLGKSNGRDWTCALPRSSAYPVTHSPQPATNSHPRQRTMGRQGQS